MIKHIFKQIWTLRRQNSWIVIELFAVFFCLLAFCDLFLIRAKTYFEAPGYDTEETFVLALKQLEPIAPGYVSPEENTMTSLDELSAIVSRIETYPDVEFLSLSYHALPYSTGGVWSSLRVDSTLTANLRHRVVSPSYFDVFRIRTVDHQPIHIESPGPRQVILSKDLAENFYGSARQAVGKQVWSGRSEADEDPYQVIGVSTLYKRKEFHPYEKCFFEILTMPNLSEWLKVNNVTGVNICVRVRPGATKHFEENFVMDMGEQLKANNLYVSSVVSSRKLYEDVVGKQIQTELIPMIYVTIFVLITVFMGIFGTFWLRTRQRRTEIGIRMAMGANKQTIKSSLILEGICLMTIALLPALLIYVNLLGMEVLDVWRLPPSVARVGIVFAGALLLTSLIIIGGTLWPAGRAASIQPVDALRDE